MEQLRNTLLPARMFVVCCVYSYGNGFVGYSNYDEILKQVQDDVSKAQWQKVSACPSTMLRTGFFLASSYCAELEAVWNVVVTEWNTTGDGEELD